MNTTKKKGLRYKCRSAGNLTFLVLQCWASVQKFLHECHSASNVGFRVPRHCVVHSFSTVLNAKVLIVNAAMLTLGFQTQIFSIFFVLKSNFY